MRNLIVRIFVNAVALWVAARMVDGISLSGEFWPMLSVAAVFGLVNALLKPIVFVLSLPFILLTLGLFTILINAGMLWVTARLMDALTVDGLWAALLGSVLISVVSLLFSFLLPEKGGTRGS
jgi:putative membrane protein